MMFFRKIDDIRYEMQFDRPYNLKEVLNFISKNIIDSYSIIIHNDKDINDNYKYVHRCIYNYDLYQIDIYIR